ncbi:hypothetical protein PTKIN_Ptkin08bG0136900 [Pterospermum kingtungense]
MYTVHAVKEYLLDWVQAKSGRSAGLVSSFIISDVCLSWNCPAPGFIKCNIDATFVPHADMIGVGIVLRNDLAEFIACKFVPCMGSFSVKEPEALGLYHALSWIRSLGFV